MHNPFAIRLQNVSKIYRLHGSPRDQLIDVLNLKRIGLKPHSPTKEFAALNNVSLDVPRGHRIGIVGRNGAGKTTLLKLICGNYLPTSGTVLVNGTVQALMSVGLGFHPEYSGRENIEASLQYNGLSKEQYKNAIDGIIDFCELGDFLDQPFKSYSLGMQARLMFATATAIQPDILIVDEVLGAGDAYFVAKSKARVEGLIKSGCTMLLVSHSMQQILELCDEAIWLESGAIRLQGDAFTVVKAYEESMHGRINNKIPLKSISQAEKNDSPAYHSADGHAKLDLLTENKRFDISNSLAMQVPTFLPNMITPSFPDYVIAEISTFHFIAPGGVSRWDSETGVKLIGFAIQTCHGLSKKITALNPAKFIMTLVGEVSGDFYCRYGIVVNDLLGNVVTRIYSPADKFSIKEGERRVVEMILNPVQLGPGEYVVGISVLDATDLELINSAKRYDLLGRSFSFSVVLPETLSAISANYIHSAEWQFSDTEI